MKQPVIACIGAGNMGKSILSGLIKNNFSPQQLWAVDPNEAKLTELKQQYAINISDDAKIAVAAAKIIILAVKPQILVPVASTISHFLTADTLVISIAAGIKMHSLQSSLGEKTAIIRAMPNTPALLGCAATALFSNPYLTAAQKQIAEQIMQAIGICIWVEEEKWMDIITALSGSGPAYFFLMMEALEESAQALGLPPEISHLLTIQTAYGAARMALENQLPLAKLRAQVTSPGGTTEKALAILEEHNIREIFKKALTGATLRAQELAKK